MAERPNTIIYNALASRSQHEAIGFFAERGVVVPNGVDTDAFHPDAGARIAVRTEWEIPERAMLIGHVARLHRQKDHSTLLNAFALVRQKFPETRLMMVGGGDEEVCLRAQAASLSVAESVIFAGVRHDVPHLTAAFDVAVNSSYSEAFPNAVVEAMACGVPVVATDVGDSRYAVGGTGRIVPPRNPEALAEALMAVLALPAQERLLLGVRARERVTSRFSLAGMAQAFDKVMEEACFS